MTGLKSETAKILISFDSEIKTCWALLNVQAVEIRSSTIMYTPFSIICVPFNLIGWTYFLMGGGMSDTEK